MNCLLDRNDEIFRKIAERCFSQDEDSPQNDGDSCGPAYGSDGSLSLTIDAYSNEFGPVTIEMSGPAQFRSPYLAGPSRLTAWLGDTCEADGSNTVTVSAPRICEDPNTSAEYPAFTDGRIQAAVDSLETFLGENLRVFELSDKIVKADYDIITTLSALSAVAEDERQTYPTELVKRFFEGIDYSMPLEQITTEFKTRLRKLDNYISTTLNLRGKTADLFVCQRSAHEVIASTYKFGCGEFAILFLSLMRAAGKKARLVKVVKDDFKEKSNDMGHDVVEVLDEETGKWIMVDPTFGTVNRKYNSEKQFQYKGMKWIRIGEWDSNWSAGCFSKSDNTAMRRKAMDKFYDPALPFVDIDDPDEKPAAAKQKR